MKIEFLQPKPRVEDWRVRLDGRTVGSVWRAGGEYLVSVSTKVRCATKTDAFRAAQKQVRALFVVRDCQHLPT